MTGTFLFIMFCLLCVHLDALSVIIFVFYYTNIMYLKEWNEVQIQVCSHLVPIENNLFCVENVWRIYILIDWLRLKGLKESKLFIWNFQK